MKENQKLKGKGKNALDASTEDTDLMRGYNVVDGDDDFVCVDEFDEPAAPRTAVVQQVKQPKPAQ